MLEVLREFREKLDNIMCKAFGRRIVLYGYGRTGRFLDWYAEYYHGIQVDFIITDDWSPAIPYSLPYFRDSLFDFNYKDVKDSIVWLALPGNAEARKKCEEHGLEYYDFAEIIYGDRLVASEDDYATVFTRRKSGIHDVQFVEYLECFYNCNFVTAVERKYLIDGGNLTSARYAISAQREIFPILDNCHVLPGEEDAILDFGCGKGGAMLTFLDYGFKNVGGVEYTAELYDVAVQNFQNLGIPTSPTAGKGVSLLCGDAAKLTDVLDVYNWFYFFDPFGRPVFEPVIENIRASYQRKPREIHIISINPRFHDVIESSGIFTLTGQFCGATRQKVVNVYKAKA